jgi:hypothetical protein
MASPIWFRIVKDYQGNNEGPTVPFFSARSGAIQPARREMVKPNYGRY